jgi:uncharacterized membrane protein
MTDVPGPGPRTSTGTATAAGPGGEDAGGRDDAGPALVLAGLVAVYVATFGTLTWQQHANFGTFGFDLGIYDQGIWLLSRLRDPFVTVRGLDYFGHHVNPVTLAFVPFYWLGAGPHFLLLVQTLWIAAGAIPLWLLARDRLGGGWPALVPAGAYLAYPSVEWMNWWHFHPDTLAIAPLFAAWLFATRRRWRWFWLAAGVALACKEDAALAVAVMGLLVARRGDRRVGLTAAAVAAGWFVVATRVIIPRANGGLGPFYTELFPGFGNSLPEIAWNMLRHPGRLWRLATEGGVASPRTYYWRLLVPVGFLPLLAPGVALVAAPQVLVNVVSGHGYTHDIRFHYSALVAAGLFLATVEGLGHLRRQAVRNLAVVVLAVAALYGNVTWSPSPLGPHLNDGTWARRPGASAAAARTAVAMVPAGAKVSAVYNLVPHLTHRVHIYEWPNPFVAANWGTTGSPPPDPRNADWLVLNRGLIGPSAGLLDRLTGPGGPFRIVFERDGIVVARRVAPLRVPPGGFTETGT